LSLIIPMSNRRAKFPLNQAAVRAANKSVGGRKLTMSAADYPDRVKWMDAYITAGGEVDTGNTKKPVKSPKPPCPPCPPPDFVVDAPCKIIKVDGGKVTLTAKELPGNPSRSYNWTTTSLKIKLINTNSPVVTVEGLATPSAGRDAETITVTRTIPGCPTITKNVNVTVAKVTFSSAASQRYGYDDFDTPADPLDDHICIKSSDHTFLKVVIEGSALSTDFDFLCDNNGICTPVPPGSASASFDLRLNAGAVANKGNTFLQAKVKCLSAASFAKIGINVYKEKEVQVVVAKVYDSTKAGTNLRFPTENYSTFQNTANGKLKEAVSKFLISNYKADNSLADVRYDLDGNGSLTYDIKNNGGTELDAIKRAMTGTGTKTRIAIVRSMKSYYYLSAATAIGETRIRVTAAKVFDPGRAVALGTGASSELVTFAANGIAGNTITLASALTKAHAIGDPLEFPAAGWSSDPIIIIEGSASVDILKWTIIHEVGHRNLNLSDVDDQKSIMHHQQSWTDYRLRYCPRNKHYESGTQNQWETIPR